MTTKNAILLIVKQNNGIDYNSLLNKFASSYSNVNSARAALSRSLKDLTTFGFIARKGNRFYIMEKGSTEIFSELKNKLVLSLNESMKQKTPENEIDSIVSRLHVLIERGREDRDLLKTSKSSLDFYISDLEEIQGRVEEKAKHMKYLSRVFSGQIGSLKELGFNDSFSRDFTEENSARLVEIISSLNEKEFAVECQTEQAFEELSKQFGQKQRDRLFVLSSDSLTAFLVALRSAPEKYSNTVITIYSSSLKAQFFLGKIFLKGPHSDIRDWILKPAEKKA